MSRVCIFLLPAAAMAFVRLAVPVASALHLNLETDRACPGRCAHSGAFGPTADSIPRMLWRRSCFPLRCELDVLQPTLNLPVPCCAIFVMCVLAWLWQQERDAALHMFKSGHKNVLIATDVAARGLDVKVRRKCILMRALAHARTQLLPPCPALWTLPVVRSQVRVHLARNPLGLYS